MFHPCQLKCDLQNGLPFRFYLYYFKKQREIKRENDLQRDISHLGSLFRCLQSRTGPGHSQDPRIQSVSSMWVAEAQLPKPSAAPSHNAH